MSLLGDRHRHVAPLSLFNGRRCSYGVNLCGRTMSMTVRIAIWDLVRGAMSKCTFKSGFALLVPGDRRKQTDRFRQKLKFLAFFACSVRQCMRMSPNLNEWTGGMPHLRIPQVLPELHFRTFDPFMAMMEVIASSRRDIRRVEDNCVLNCSNENGHCALGSHF